MKEDTIDYVLAVNTHDNDYATLMRGIFGTIAAGIDQAGIRPFMEDRRGVATLIVDMIPSHYALFQSHGTLLDINSRGSIIDHLEGRIFRNIHFNSDVDSMLALSLDYNCELTVLDMRLPRDQRVYTL
jgi:hypothetical protein